MSINRDSENWSDNKMSSKIAKKIFWDRINRSKDGYNSNIIQWNFRQNWAIEIKSISDSTLASVSKIF